MGISFILFYLVIVWFGVPLSMKLKENIIEIEKRIHTFCKKCVLEFQIIRKLNQNHKLIENKYFEF